MSSEEKILTVYDKIVSNEKAIQDLQKRVTTLEKKLTFKTTLSDAEKRKVGIC